MRNVSQTTKLTLESLGWAVMPKACLLTGTTVGRGGGRHVRSTSVTRPILFPFCTAPVAVGFLDLQRIYLALKGWLWLEYASQGVSLCGVGVWWRAVCFFFLQGWGRMSSFSIPLMRSWQIIPPLCCRIEICFVCFLFCFVCCCFSLLCSDLEGAWTLHSNPKTKPETESSPAP